MSRLARAQALRVKPRDMGAVWGALSVTLTEVAAKFTPGCGVRCYPKASEPAPGCCYSEAATILLDGDLISEPEALSGGLTRELRAELAVLYGVLTHECGHANHTEANVDRHCHEAGYLAEKKLLEEPRMETRLASEHPRVRRFLQAAVSKLIAADLPKAGDPISRAAAAHTCVLLTGREHAGSLPPALKPSVDELVDSALGKSDAERLRKLLARVCAIADGDAEGMLEACKEYREIVGPDPEAELMAALGALVGAILRELEERGEEVAGDLAQESEDETSEEGEDLDAVAKEIADEAEEAERREERRKLIAHGVGGGARFSARAGGRPGAVERRAAAELAKRLRRVRARRTARVASPTPGRFHAPSAVRLAADRARGAPSKVEPFRRREEIKEALWAPEVGVAIDTSGSMSSHSDTLACVLWVVARAIRDLGGRFAAVGFGDDGTLIMGSGDRLTAVPEFECSGGTERFDLAAPILRGELRYSDRRRPRLLVICSDGIWTSAVEASEAHLAEIRRLGVATVHVGIGEPPVEHGAESVGAIPDAEALGRVLGEECRRALEGRGGRS